MTCRNFRDIKTEALLQSNAISDVIAGSCKGSNVKFVLKSYHKKAMTTHECTKVWHRALESYLEFSKEPLLG